MNRFPLTALLLSSVMAVATPPTPVRADEKSDFFESKIRPLLVDNCYGCHSAEAGEIKGGLQLDNRAGLMKGGASGAAVAPGAPAQSLLMRALKWEDENLRMPPEGKLSAEQIADVEKWIKDGAFDPREGEVVKSPIEQLIADADKHWSFKPVRDPAVPPVGAAHPVDAFLLVKLREAKLDFSPEADRRTLVRRAYLDLLGVPPTFAEVESYVADASPDAYDRLLDRLLADPRYGERWGRHWLDVARYSDSKGAVLGGEDPYPHAHTYRDYVIRSFNDDKPYDRFLLEQLAADQLEISQDTQTLTAMAFIGLSRRKGGEYDDDAVDDTLDVIGRGLMGLTISCARCHDHKLEPITTQDYYALFGVIRSSKEPDILPALPLEDTPEACEFVEKNRAARVGYIETTWSATFRGSAEARGRLGDYLRVAHESGWKTTGDHKPVVEVLKERKLKGSIYDSLVRSRKTWIDKHPEIFAPYFEFEAGKPLEPPVPPHPLVADEFVTPATTIEQFAERYNRIFAAVHAAWWKGVEREVTKPVELAGEDVDLPSTKLRLTLLARMEKLEKERVVADGVIESLRQSMLDKDSPLRFIDPFRIAQVFDEQENKSLAAFDKAIGEAAKHPGAPSRAMVFVESERIYNSRVYVRGNPRLPGPEAPRKFLTALSSISPELYPKDRSGRLDFAHAVVSPANPLTYRVIANRVWLWHFGNGIVRSPSDFGFRGDPPTHPELLDHLATWFMNHGRSFKQLHRYLMTSRAYRQSSTAAPDALGLKVDLDDRLLWRFPMRQLEFEAYRDSLLAVTGLLNPARGGRPASILSDDPAALRRTVYGTVDRKSLPGLYRSFDFPDPGFTAPQRTRSTLPPKALVLLNSPWILKAAKTLAEQLKSCPDDAARIDELYRRVVQRLPTASERARVTAFLAAYPENDLVRPEVRDWQYGYGGFDEAGGKVTDFAPLTAFTGKDWRATTKDAEGKPIVVAVDAQGGDPGPGVKMGSIRRWTAPIDGTVNITAELVHSDEKTEGVVARVVSSRTGVLGRWEARRSAVMTDLADVEVKKGDSLDFLVAGIGESDGGIYRWAPSIRMPTGQMPGIPGMPPRWDARLDFADPAKPQPRLSAWEELVQVMLISSELTMLE